jgi:hypothetical protein
VRLEHSHADGPPSTQEQNSNGRRLDSETRRNLADVHALQFHELEYLSLPRRQRREVCGDELLQPGRVVIFADGFTAGVIPLLNLSCEQRTPTVFSAAPLERHVPRYAV